MGSKVDAAGVEFVPGTAPEEWALKPAKVASLPPRTDTSLILKSERRSVHLWFLDFYQCKLLSTDDSGIKQAVAAFWQENPYSPRLHRRKLPDEEPWTLFRARYLLHSEKTPDSRAQRQFLARQSIDGVVTEAMRRASTTNGPPRGSSAPRSRFLIVSPPRGGLPQEETS